ncbi:NAD(P)-binding domain-containing protein [Carboxylicivirga linearis]|uniref:6-phosphogluconate dehydrogenase NADP-binding domain-containing protein n=1 Tax=Carboxylicivirga linearis TaxID=1628157 RepID=A0ABS5JQC1_9BACT|nr:NAD(P)-binding domain-containing protein [Carboxylicivirga linearis]MBS2097035.1 hypothetical protein [Carboxylicivirga linearis]
MENKTISILGCGWLGYPLALNLQSSGWKVKGSSTSESKQKTLSQHQIEPYQINLNNSIEDIPNSFFDSEYLVINIPPSKLDDALNQYKKLGSIIKSSPIQKVLFISSTSAYDSDNRNAIEDDTETLPDNYNQTISFERIFQGLNKSVTILRLAGLVGPRRHPGRFFATGKSLSNPNMPVNLIHLNDCIGIIKQILERDSWNEIYNGCADTHPSKREFYTKATLKLGSTININESDAIVDGKKVSNKKIKSFLNYQFEYPDLLSMLDYDCF